MQDVTVYVAMSGGVDSSVAAALLVEQGYNCVGVTLKTFCYGTTPTSDRSCCSLESIRDARAVCHKLDIPHYVLDVNEFFDEKVIDHFTCEYLSGRTPNPCVECNRHVKFDYLMKKVAAKPTDRVATGHYARIFSHGGRFGMKRGLDRAKDQTYFLWGLSQEELSRIRYPVGELPKAETREIARKLGLNVAEKVDSQEICFVPDNDYAGFVARRVGDQIKPGPILTMQGQKVGEHRGISNYTIGQRRGLGIAMNRPVYVARIDVARNAIYIGDDDDLFRSVFTAGLVNWISIDPPREAQRALAQIRYRHEAAPGILVVKEDTIVEFIFDDAQRAITPGQSVVFYDETNEICLAGGIINRVD